MKKISEVCKICGNDKLHKKYIVNDFIVKECNKCGFAQVINIDPSVKYDYNSDYFDNMKYNDKKSLIKELKRRKSLLKKYCRAGSKVIDIGCAAGDFVSYLKEEFDIFGCDFSESAIKLAKTQNKSIADKFWASPVEKIDNNVKYDAICLWDVIEHIFEPRSVITDLMNILNKGGYLFISTPNIESNFAKLLKEKWPFMTPPEHVCFFTKKSISFIAENNKAIVLHWTSRGKWVNLGFILYKINRIKPGFISDKLINYFKKGLLSRINIYVPTKDIQYVVIRKNK